MIDAEQVRRAAEEVLDGAAYGDLERNPLTRLLAEVRSWFAEQLFDLFSGQAAANIGLVIAGVVVLVVVVLGVVALLGVRRRAAADLLVEQDPGTTPEEALAAADDARAAGDLSTAVRRRYGALVLLLVDRDVLPQLPGLTVGEVDAAVARAAPACAATVVEAGRALADIVYGHREATPADDDRVATAVREVRQAVPRRAVAV